MGNENWKKWELRKSGRAVTLKFDPLEKKPSESI
jgi:hypothetical protein